MDSRARTLLILIMVLLLFGVAGCGVMLMRSGGMPRLLFLVAAVLLVYLTVVVGRRLKQN